MQVTKTRGDFSALLCRGRRGGGEKGPQMSENFTCGRHKLKNDGPFDMGWGHKSARCLIFLRVLNDYKKGAGGGHMGQLCPLLTSTREQVYQHIDRQCGVTFYGRV